MPVVEYKLHRIDGASQTKVIPPFIDDGGYWSKDNGTMLGWTVPSAQRDWYVPSTLVELDKAGVVARLLAMHSANAFNVANEDPTADEVAMTTDQVTAMAETWYDSYTSGK
jgi:hypothetical protein|tara:strand:+ start:1937 stop:2269 length:333 start_codon:yes stop_codon:yes gene_type:complete